jgi:hypothetical protein
VTTAAGIPDARVPGYLGRVLDGAGAPVGTCFQVAPGVLATAWHVLDDLGAVTENARVRIDPLAGGRAFEAAVVRMDPLRDLAVLTTATGLSAAAGPLVATDQVPLRATVTVTGHAAPDDPGHMYRFLNAPGEWAGGTTRDDAVPLGRMTSTAVVPGMSGAPVIRDSDGAVAGVVSGRYNSIDGWLAGTAWVARTEDLAALLNGIADVTMRQARQESKVVVYGYTQQFAINPRVQVFWNGSPVGSVKKGDRISIEIDADGEISFKSSIRKASLWIQAGQVTKIKISWDRISGKMIPQIVDVVTPTV